MPNFKVSDVSRAASLLKKLVEKSDVNRDGAVRGAEGGSVTPKRMPATNIKRLGPGHAVTSVQRFALSKGSAQVKDIKKAVDEVAKRVRAGDKDQDGFISESELKKLSTVAERTFVMFGRDFAHKSLEDFNLPAPREPKAPRFSWKGTPAEVTSSLLDAYSDRKNDNFWPSWSGSGPGPSRYVLTDAEAKKMVKALEPLYPSRQKAVLSELARRTERSTFGCVSVNAAARKVFESYAARLGVADLEFKSPAAPKMPAP